MASIIREPNGRRRIEFFDHEGKRRRIRLGKVSQRQAEAYRGQIEHLTNAKINGDAPDRNTALWLAGLGDVMRRRFAAAGLIEARESATLGAFIAAYLARRTDIKPRTRLVLERARDALEDFFTPAKPLRAITRGDAADWRRHLLQRGSKRGGKLAENTVATNVKRAKQFFADAIERRLVEENPFAKLPAAVGSSSEEREYFITRAEAAAVLAACPDGEWRLIFALSRFGGLRCPSEHFGLRRCDVDWQGQTFTVHSPKTEHHPKGVKRVVPIFPELRPYLAAVFESEPEAPEGAYVIRRRNASFRTTMQRIIRRAGLEPWPKLFQNLRATRQTELEEIFPSHVVCAWIGNSESVARKHYLRVTPEHYARAVEEAQNAAQSVRPKCAPSGTIGDTKRDKTAESTVLPLKNGTDKYARRELNYTRFRPEIAQILRMGAVSGAFCELAALWPAIPPHVRRKVMRLARGVGHPVP